MRLYGAWDAGRDAAKMTSFEVWDVLKGWDVSLDGWEGEVCSSSDGSYGNSRWLRSISLGWKR